MASSTSEPNHRDHALHNKEVYEYLKENGQDYIDWVITTAFYSSLHFVEHKLFPFSTKIGGNEYHIESIEEYKQICGRPNKHSARKKAVKKQLRNCRTAFEGLYDLCFTARYHQYQFENAEYIEKQVDHWLNKIEKECCN